MNARQQPVTSVAVAAVGRRAVSGEGGLSAKTPSALLVWDLPTRSLRSRLSGHEWPIRSVAISADGKTLASGDEGGRVKLWALGESVPAHP